MRVYPRVRKTIKWAGAGIFVLLVVAWAASLRWQARWEGSEYRYLLNAGELHGEVSDWQLMATHPPTLLGWHLDDQPTWPRWEASYTLPRFNSEENIRFVPDDISFNLPLWLPALLTLALTIPAWRLDALARRRSGLCLKCSYSLVGLPAGSKCPECGKPGIGSAS